jgi:hypothetical protein
MKKNLFTLIFLASLSALPVKATQFWYDVVTNYPLGCITTNTTLWYPHPPGTVTANDALIVSRTYTSGAAVSGRRLAIDGTKAEYIMRLFDPVATNSYPSGNGTILYASFIASANVVPAAGVGTYFAALNDLGTAPASATNGFEFRGRISEVGVTNAYPFTNRVSNTYQFGVANAANDASASPSGLPSILFAPIDLKGNIDYQVVLRYDIDNATATIWVNPASESDTANSSGLTGDNGRGSPAAQWTFAISRSARRSPT